MMYTTQTILLLVAVYIGGLITPKAVFKQVLKTAGKLAEETAKHGFSVRLERIKSIIGRSSAKATRLDEHEFKCLPKAWKKLGRALGAGHFVMSPLQNYDLPYIFTPNQLDQALARTPFEQDWKDEIKALVDPKEQHRLYISYTNYLRIFEAERERARFHNYVIKNEILMERGIADKLLELSDALRLCLIDHRFWKIERNGHRSVEAALEANRKIEQLPLLRDEIKEMIRHRLKSDDA